jgi:hypothetical protein
MKRNKHSKKKKSGVANLAQDAIKVLELYEKNKRRRRMKARFDRPIMKRNNAFKKRKAG